MTDSSELRQNTGMDDEPVAMRLCLAAYFVREARRLVAVAAADAETDPSSVAGLDALVELDAIAGELARAEARLHRLFRPRSP